MEEEENAHQQYENLLTRNRLFTPVWVRSHSRMEFGTDCRAMRNSGDQIRLDPNKRATLAFSDIYVIRLNTIVLFPVIRHLFLWVIIHLFPGQLSLWNFTILCNSRGRSSQYSCHILWYDKYLFAASILCWDHAANASAKGGGSNFNLLKIFFRPLTVSTGWRQ